MEQVIVLARSRGMSHSLCGQMIEFLKYLFVLPEHQFGGVLFALITAVLAEAKAECSGGRRWITLDNNYRVLGLYGKLVEKTHWALYGMAAK